VGGKVPAAPRNDKILHFSGDQDSADGPVFEQFRYAKYQPGTSSIGSLTEYTMGTRGAQRAS